MLLPDDTSSIEPQSRASRRIEVFSILFGAVLFSIGIDWCVDAWQDVWDPASHWKVPRPVWVNICSLFKLIACSMSALLMAVAAGWTLVAKVAIPNIQASASGCLLMSVLAASVMLTEQRWWYPTISRTDVLVRMAMSGFGIGIYPALALVHHRQQPLRR